jgi:hypothetical protein
LILVPQKTSGSPVKGIKGFFNPRGGIAMADTYLVSATIITWKVGVDGKAVFVRSDNEAGVFEAANDEQLKQKLLARWARDQKDPAAALDQVINGLVTVEVQTRSIITRPALPEADVTTLLQNLLNTLGFKGTTGATTGTTGASTGATKTP